MVARPSPLLLSAVVESARVVGLLGLFVEFAIVISPAAPDVSLTSESRCVPSALVNTLAATPGLAALIAAESPASVAAVELSPTLTVHHAPLPTLKVMPPVNVSEAPTASDAALDVCARFCTTTVCVPAAAVELAEDRDNTFVSELEPVLYAITPWKSVRLCKSLESVEICVPRLESAVSLLCRLVN